MSTTLASVTTSEKGNLNTSIDNVSGDVVDNEELEASEEEPEGSEEAPKLTVAQRARIERNRLRARALQDARLVQRPPTVGGESSTASKAGGRALDSGGGFLLEEEPAPPPPKVARDAPVLDPADQPRCLHCGTRFPQSYLFDTFDYHVCDACRDPDDAHSLVTRTEAKSEFLLQDCDLDSRPPPLRCVRRRNPHRGARSDMRLYLRAQLLARALHVWGSLDELEAERARRRDKRELAKHKQTQRRLRALRMDVRSSLYERTTKAHEHRFGPERHDAAADVYERECLECGHRETYEKM